MINIFLMSEPDIEGYIRENLPEYFAADEKLVCKEIGDGNLNYVFRLANENGKSIIIKQAGEELRISRNLSFLQTEEEELRQMFFSYRVNMHRVLFQKFIYMMK